MIISANLKEVEKSFEAVIKDIEVRLTNMAVGFGQMVAAKAESQNPIGLNTPSMQDYYEARQRLGPYHLQPTPGFSKGSWQATESSSFPWRETYGGGAGQAAVAAIPSQLSGYKLGDTYYVGNTGPYIGILNQRYNIIDISTRDIMQAFSIDMSAIYNKG